MAKHFSLFGGLGLPENITKHHYAIVAISGACTIAAHVGKAYFTNKSKQEIAQKLQTMPQPELQKEAAQTKKGKRSMQRVASSSDLKESGDETRDGKQHKNDNN